MARARRPSPQTLEVLVALAREPARWRYGYELGAEVGLPSGSLYPILVRLSDRELLEASWEVEPPPGRPARHMYRLTTRGREHATLHAAARKAPSPRRAPAVGGAS